VVPAEHDAAFRDALAGLVYALPPATHGAESSRSVAHR